MRKFRMKDWIPCEKALPELGERVLVSVWFECEEEGYVYLPCVEIGRRIGDDEWEVFEDDAPPILQVFAWMPFPMVYNGAIEEFVRTMDKKWGLKEE